MKPQGNKKEVWERKIKRHWQLLVILLLIFVFLVYPPVVFSEVRVDFADENYTAGNHLKIFASFTENVGVRSLQTTYEKPGYSRICIWDPMFRTGEYIRRIDPIDYYADHDITIRDFVFYINGFYAGTLDGEALFKSLDPITQAELYLSDDGSLGIRIQGEDSQLKPNEAFQEFYRDCTKRYARTGVLYIIPTLAVLYFVVWFYRRHVIGGVTKKGQQLVNTLLYCVAMMALLLIFVGVFTGSMEISPDETESVYSVQYYIHNWWPPDVRELEPEAFSTFGTARLTELNLYYMFAAAIARFFTFDHAVRFFGFLLAAGMFFLAFYQMKRNRYLLCVLFLTPQVWYLYTYCTSDAMDFAVAFLVLYQLITPESMLQSLCRRGVQKKEIGRILILGFLFSNIFMSKQNYYVIAIYAFLTLLAELFQVKGEERKKRLICYLWLAGTALLFLGIRYIPEFLHYGLSKWRIILEVQNEVAIPKLRPNSPPEIQSSAFNLYGKGVTLRELLFGMHLHKVLFSSFVGTYGSLTFPSPKWYVWLMGILYLILYGGISICIWKTKDNREQKIKFILLHVVGFVSYGLVIFNAYFIDFQAQGRYMLPVVVLVAHAASLCPGLAEKRWFQGLFCVLAILGLYSFGFICIPNIKPV